MAHLNSVTFYGNKLACDSLGANLAHKARPLPFAIHLLWFCCFCLHNTTQGEGFLETTQGPLVRDPCLPATSQVKLGAPRTRALGLPLG